MDADASTSQFSAPSGAVVTSLLLPDLYGTQPLVAQVLGAESTATTYLLNCPPGTDGNDCGTYNQSITLGPWASQTLPPGADETGVFDLFITDSFRPWEFSIHCEMSRTVAQECTTINNGGNDDGTPTATFTASDQLEAMDLATFVQTEVTITAGQEALQSGGGARADASGTSPSTGSETSGADAASASGNANGDSAGSILRLSPWVIGFVAVFAFSNGLLLL